MASGPTRPLVVKPVKRIDLAPIMSGKSKVSIRQVQATIVHCRLIGNYSGFTLFFKLIDNSYYSGPFIMETYRDEEGVSVFKKQLSWLIERGYV